MSRILISNAYRYYVVYSTAKEGKSFKLFILTYAQLVIVKMTNACHASLSAMRIDIMLSIVSIYFSVLDSVADTEKAGSEDNYKETYD